MPGSWPDSRASTGRRPCRNSHCISHRCWARRPDEPSTGRRELGQIELKRAEPRGLSSTRLFCSANARRPSCYRPAALRRDLTATCCTGQFVPGTVSVTVYGFASAYACVCCAAPLVTFVPSPKSHSYDGAVAPFWPETVKTNSSGSATPLTTRPSTVKSKTQLRRASCSSRTLTVAVYVTVATPSLTGSETLYLPAPA